MFTLHRIYSGIDTLIDEVWIDATIGQLGKSIALFSPNIQKDPTKWLKILLDVIGLGFAQAAAPIWNIG